jgi:hypothetical protein
MNRDDCLNWMFFPLKEALAPAKMELPLIDGRGQPVMT